MLTMETCTTIKVTELLYIYDVYTVYVYLQELQYQKYSKIICIKRTETKQYLLSLY